ncbi:MAG: Similar to F420-dependent glucose-6-phosphate dehydrogenase, Mext_1273 family [uncultured Chloroflexia bacterium]|uniref:Similar to F420-dependent glucose-6-phosphate dehydrogenase, Mext_1273 family n=1 Tax=uncultured Chloroflexia bacterium TaxID=1672391 RepID=A0A6J4KCC4_9CHLR|nr:MAG: Similar to F420-dependent glucose-6-phosphate dehydrogenase, Mext_1273 family [uncultured Chloroflexia bacterium]
MTTIGYHASHEMFAPSELLRYVQQAEAAGFGAAMCSDHFYPWSERQGQSGFAWSWLGAALQTTSLSFGLVNAPGQRYNPAIVAQAAATLQEMFEGRLWVAMGSGQALNEHITGAVWPTKAQRNARLLEAVTVIRALWAGEDVTHHGSFDVVEAKLYTRPKTPPNIIGAAITPETAAWVAGWADGMITVCQDPETMQAVVAAFREHGGAAKPMYLQAQHSYGQSEQAAREGAYDQWRTNIFPSAVLSDLRRPQQFDLAAQFVRPDDLDRSIRISSDPARHVQWLREYIEMGFDRIYLHNVNREQERFIDTFGTHVLPALR